MTLFLTSALMASLPVNARNYLVPLNEVVSKLGEAQPGDRIVVKDGVYENQDLKWTGGGNATTPVIIEPQTKGGVIIKGASSLVLSAHNLVVRGLYFLDGSPLRRSVIETSHGSQSSNDCRITECVIKNFNTSDRSEKRSYVILSGKNIRVDHCQFVEKQNIGVTLIVNLNGPAFLANHHRIDHNYFGPRAVYGSNGAETIRIGTSQQSYESSNTLVENNAFDRCSGEVEVVSVKSCDNIIRGNYFYECEGLVALRHGKRNIVEENTFIGNGKKNTGGVRIVDEGHIVRNNRFYNLAGKRFFSALAIMDCVPNSLPNRYVQVKNIEISGNVYVDCSNLELGTGRDEERTLPPQNVLFKDNTIINRSLTAPFLWIDSATCITCVDNKVDLAQPISAEGFVNKHLRSPKIPTYGEMLLETLEGRVAEFPKGALQSTNVTVRDTDDLSKVVREAPAGSNLFLQGEEYRLYETVLVDKPITIKSETGHSILRSVSNLRNLVTLKDGARLNISGVVFDGSTALGSSVVEAGISTEKKMSGVYSLVVEGCEFRNFNESGCSGIRGLKSTFADSVLVKDCSFSDFSGSGINYSYENEDKGIYSAEVILIQNCSFERFLGIPVNIYRGGSDESTAGPHVEITDCRFADCCNKGRGSVLRLIGPQYLRVTRCKFQNSGRGGVSIRLDETAWEDVAISDCTFSNSGRVLSMTGKALK